MIGYLAAFGLSLVLFSLLRNQISKSHELERQTLKNAHSELRAKYEQLLRTQALLRNELNELGTRIAFLHAQAQERTAARIKKLASPQDKRERENALGDLLVSQGFITLEQHQKALSSKESMKMDILSTCLTLGFIDADTANKVLSHFQE
ncbi:MAG: hypothetical protein V3573_11730 [Desulfovibrionaceae bacterium]